MAKTTSKTSCGPVLLMSFTVFWVLLATAAKGEAPSGRNEAKGKQMNTEISFNDFSMVCRYLIDHVSRPMTKISFNPSSSAFIFKYFDHATLKNYIFAVIQSSI